MSRLLRVLPLSLFLATAGMGSLAQQKATPASANSAVERAIAAAEAGHCSQALPVLARTAAHLADSVLLKRAAVDGVRCATLLQQWNQLENFVHILSQKFPNDPEVLYISVHAFSDLSLHAEQQLAHTAPHSLPALEMDAEANEAQGRWDQAEKDYREILEKDPRYPGIHFRLARLLLSRPNPAPGFQQEAKKELQAELAIDPSNAAAEYISGELDGQMQDFPAAVQHFTRAARLDATFADAWLGLGKSLLSEKQYQSAIAPLQTAVRLEPSNPAAHYALATAYARTGNKQAAEHEFALQQQTSQGSDSQGDKAPQ